MAKKGSKEATGSKLDTVGVPGSIPGGPTIFKLPSEAQVIEIPEEYDVLPAIRWEDGLCQMYRVLVKRSDKRGDIAVTSRRSSKKGVA